MDDEQFEADAAALTEAILGDGDATDEAKQAAVRLAIGFLRDFREINASLKNLLTVGKEDDA